MKASNSIPIFLKILAPLGVGYQFLRKEELQIPTVEIWRVEKETADLLRGALFEIGNFGPRNSAGLCVEMTAGSARSPPSCCVGGGRRKGDEGKARAGIPATLSPVAWAAYIDPPMAEQSVHDP